MNLENAGTDVKATKNELLPSVNIFGEYVASGLGGVQTSTTTTPTGAFLPGLPVVNSAGVPVPDLFQATAVTTSSAVVFPGGAGQDLGRVFRGNYSTFEGGINFTLPIRNRAAQADNAQALLNERQQKTQYRQEQNAIFVSVRNALIAMQEDRASLAAAEEAQEAGRSNARRRAGKIPAGSVHQLQRRAAIARRHLRRGHGIARSNQPARR